VFAIKTRPLIDYYAHRGLLTNVDAIGPIEVVTKRILAALEVNRRAV
jgi:adenylate kinase family enzyme